MDSSLIFNFKTDISSIEIPQKLNNPFLLNISDISKIAAKEFQEHIALVSPKWEYDFNTRPGKMFGILVVQKENGSIGFLGAMSGNLPNYKTAKKFTPPIFDESTDDYFFNRGMIEVTKIGNAMNKATCPKQKKELFKKRSQKSKEVQKHLFENFNFTNLACEEKNVLKIFEDAALGKPPASAGDCAAPKLLNYAFKNNLKAISIAEFWWGKPTKNQVKEHKAFYPACKSKCQPILEYMLNDNKLYKELI